MRIPTFWLISVIYTFTILGSRAQTPPSAEEVLAKAKKKATAENKALFVHFGASWCGWCKRLETFLASKEVQPIFDKYFVSVKLVVQESEPNRKLEHAGAEAVLKRVGGPEGLPFHAFLDLKGDLIVNSRRPGGGNIGHPFEPKEIEWFMTMLRKAAPKITDAELKSIEDWLKRQKK